MKEKDTVISYINMRIDIKTSEMHSIQQSIDAFTERVQIQLATIERLKAEIAELESLHVVGGE